MGGVGALLAASSDQALVLQARQQQVQGPLLQAMGEDSGAKLAQHPGVNTGLGQTQPKRIFPVDPQPDRVGRLPVSQVLRHLQHRDQRQPPRRPARPTPYSERLSELGIPEQHAQLVSDLDRQRRLPPLAVDSTHRPGDLLGRLRPRPRLDRHHTPPGDKRRKHDHDQASEHPTKLASRVHPNAVNRWVKRYRQGGFQALSERRRDIGRAAGACQPL
jgi:hypothetical protein